MMEKNAVLGSPRNLMQKIASSGCPLCGRQVDLQGSLPRCPVHGTAPFERGASMARKVNGNR